MNLTRQRSRLRAYSTFLGPWTRGRVAKSPITGCGYGGVVTPTISLVEFPADDPDRAREFWAGFLKEELPERTVGEGWQSPAGGPAVGVHPRGRGPGDSFSLPYFEVDDMAEALARVSDLGGAVIHPGERWAVCKDSEGNPFGLARSD
jgi:predicted enzyme related to lactoylglutathione lyase